MKTYKDLQKFKDYRKQLKEEKEASYKTYIFRSDFYHLFKIGKSSNIEQRLKILRKKTPDISIVLVFNVDIEVMLHRIFKHNAIFL